jgi:hypothetical protein
MCIRYRGVMLSGCKSRVMIACVTFETVMITEPIVSYQTNRVHLIHWVTDLDEFSKRHPGEDDKIKEYREKISIYQQFYDEVKYSIENDIENVEIHEHIAKVFDFSEMLRTVLAIIASEKDSEIFVNISSGSSEFTAAAVIASMMNPDVRAFSVITDRFTIDTAENIRKSYYDKDTGRPIGLTRSVRDVKEIPKYRMEMPKEHLVLGLRILSERLRNKQHTAAKYMVYSFKHAGIWFRDTGSPSPDKPEQDQTEAVYYHRDYVTPWLDSGWVEKDDIVKNRLKVLPDGQRIVDTFYTFDNKLNRQ